MVFAECAIGAVVLTVNTTLLGGELVFFQALCLLGYCLFPICIAAVVCAAVSNKVGGCATFYELRIVKIQILHMGLTHGLAHVCHADCTHSGAGGGHHMGRLCDSAFHWQGCASRVGASKLPNTMLSQISQPPDIGALPLREQ